MRVVYKFGGSSLADRGRLQRAAELLREAKQQGNEVVCVVSAQGDETDLLLQMAAEICTAPSKRELDALLATGEQKSAALLAMLLCSMGVSASSLNAAQAGIHCSAEFGSASITGICVGKLQELLERDILPVVTGFQAVAQNGDICTLGRGGSDATACALAAALDAACVICTDVDGVFTADPRIVDGALRIPRITHEAMMELAANGAGVLMDRSAGLAMKYSLALQVRSCEPGSEGTVLCSCADEQPHFYGAAIQSGLSLVQGKAAAAEMAHLLSEVAACGGSFFGMHCRDGMIRFSFLLAQAKASSMQLLGRCALCSEARFAKVCAVGSGALHPDSMQRLQKCLSEKGIAVYALSQSAGSIWAVVEDKDKDAALCAVHGEFVS